MQILKTISEYKTVYTEKLRDKKIGFVPTMGFLHEGHLSLVRESVKNNDVTVVSIFVNPKQFAPNEDFDQYPQEIEKDIELLEREGVNAVFIPSEKEIYSDDNVFNISIADMYTDKLCGKYRDQHFVGVALIVLKLFNIIHPRNAYFGLKDYQQYQLIRRMLTELNLDVEVIGMPVIREVNGLAMSSRNAYLSGSDRELAMHIQAGLVCVKDSLLDNINDVQNASVVYEKYLTSKSDKFKLQYLEVYSRNLDEIDVIKPGDVFVGTAVYLSNIRLIDNILF